MRRVGTVAVLLAGVAWMADANTNTNTMDTNADANTNDANLITALPNLNGTVPFKQYAGHLQLPTEEKLFYWYTESQNKPSEDPIVLWLNGGPGCSSLGGFFTENGPFVVRADQSVKVNRYAWNRNVNLVWLEQPAGVGFSGPLQNASYYNDENVAQKAYEFVELFFAKYAELQGRDFYITGESYAGIYIPFLLDLLVKKPIEGVKLTGYAIGNPFTDNEIDGNAYMEYFWSHGMISLEVYDRVNQVCGKLLGKCVNELDGCSAECQAVITEATDSAQTDNLNPYYIYGDTCQLQNTQADVLHNTGKLDRPTSRRGDIGPCADTFTQIYLRNPVVQRAIHAGEQYTEWTSCSDEVGDMYVSADSALPKYRNFLGHDLRGLIYSGDADSVVNFIGTQRWIGKLGLKLNVVNKWEAWFGPDDQLAGYVQDYDGLTFKTVKGAGHMVPAVRPLHGLSMFECFVFGEEACAKFTYPVDEEEWEAGVFLDENLNAVKPVEASSSVHDSMVVAAAVCAALVTVVMIGRMKRGDKQGYESIGSSV